MKHIGIIGVTVPGAILCINTIIEESYRHFGLNSMQHPRFTYINPPLIESEHRYDSKDRDSLGKYIVGLIDNLVVAGVDFVIIPSNSPHYAIDYIKQHSILPVMSIINLVLQECIAKSYQRIGILGVSATMSDGLYENLLRDNGFDTVLLSGEDQQGLNDLIYRDIIQSSPKQSTFAAMEKYIQMLQEAGCDSFIAGCTEIPLVLNKNCPLPYIDTTRLLAQKAFEYAIK